MKLLYFAWVRERIGKDGEEIELPDGIVTIADLIDALARRGGGYKEALTDTTTLRAAKDQSLVPLHTAIGAALEIAIFPPVTGG